MIAVTTATGPPITPEALDLAYRRLATKQAAVDLREAETVTAFAAHAKRRYAEFLGVETLTPAQEEEMWDGMTDAYIRLLAQGALG